MKKKEESDKITLIVKLGLWLIFIAVLLIFSRFGNSNKNSNVEWLKNEIKENNVQMTYENKLKELINNYSYIYEIKVDDDTYKYVGNKMVNDSFIKESGYVLKNDEKLYNYFIDNGYIYQVNNGVLDKIDTIYDNRIDVNYLNIDQIKNMIFDKEYILESENKYVYNLDAKKIIIKTDDKAITNIEIIIDDNYYNLNISGIGLVKEIKY